eukprot:TRINITY_DN53808_c0_g1_i1.p1 TRINITY_DN53808_c0_g1~~TRINITY_DN53808_c0_g1_i1.p1  ORF type:complete len:285 (+),score=79.18 TRINITY_DN53808_c0_g1_i1:984-1838(+)
MELYAMNLREALQRFGAEAGKMIGMSLEEVRLYARDICVALRFIHKNGLVHADVKPDNILLNEKRTAVKLCDFGSAVRPEEAEVTSYFVSRYYRAPEIILGIGKPGTAVDMWSLGCTLYELYTGKMLFPGETNNRMLALQMQLKGKFPHKLLQKGEFRSKHFDDELTFLETTNDQNGATTTQRLATIKQREMKALLKVDEYPDDEKKKVGQFASFLEACLHPDPEQRLTAESAFLHPFIQQLQGQKKQKDEKSLAKEKAQKQVLRLKHEVEIRMKKGLKWDRQT